MPKFGLVKISLWGRLIQDFKLLYALIKDYWKGEYREVSLWSIIVFFFAIVYIISPVDVLPDFIPGTGQIDDVTVLLVCLYFLEKDLYRYKEWKDKLSNQRNSDNN